MPIKRVIILHNLATCSISLVRKRVARSQAFWEFIGTENSFHYTVSFVQKWLCIDCSCSCKISVFSVFMFCFTLICHNMQCDMCQTHVWHVYVLKFINTSIAFTKIFINIQTYSHYLVSICCTICHHVIQNPTYGNTFMCIYIITIIMKLQCSWYYLKRIWYCITQTQYRYN